MGLEKINIMRKHIGMSIDELSEKSGVPKGTLSKITAGITKNPSVDTVKSIVHAMGFTLDDLDNFPELKNKSVFSIAEMEHIKKYRSLDDYGKDIIDTILEKEYARCEDEYVEIAARSGKYKVKRESLIELAKRLDAEPYEEDHDLC